MTRFIHAGISILVLSALTTPTVHAAQTRYEHQLQLTHPATPMMATYQPSQSRTSVTEQLQQKGTKTMDAAVRPVTSGNPYIRPAAASQ